MLFRSLYNYVKGLGHQKIAYIIREDSTPSSHFERVRAFHQLDPLDHTLGLPWNYKNYLENEAESFVFDYLTPVNKPTAVICSDGEVGLKLQLALMKKNIRDVLVVSIDDFELTQAFNMTVYRQPYDAYAKQSYTCLEAQNTKPLQWEAQSYRIEGELLVRK